MPREKKWFLKDGTEIKAEHVQPIIDLLKARQFEEADEAFKKFCSSIKNWKTFEAVMLASKLITEAGVVEEMKAYQRTRRPPVIPTVPPRVGGHCGPGEKEKDHGHPRKAQRSA